MNTEIKNLYNNDIVVRLAAILIVGSLNTLMVYYFEKYPTQYNGFFISRIITSAIILWLSFICVKTAFSQDVREFFIADIFYYALLFSLYMISDCVKTKNHCEYATMLSYYGLYNLVSYAIFAARTLSPFKDAKTGEFVNWPVFGPVGLYLKSRKNNLRYASPSKRQTVIAYCLMLLAVAAGVALWINDADYVIVLQSSVITATLIFGAIKTPAAISAHLAERRLEKERVELEKAQILELAQKAELEKANAEVEAARLAAECEGLQVVVAQTVVEKERASAEAARASAEAAQLAQANQGLKEVVAKNETAIIYQVEFTNKLQEEQSKERARFEQIAEDARAEGNIAKLGQLMLRIMNPKHPHHSVRLHAAIEMWAHFENEDLTNASPQDALNAWAWNNAKKLGLMHGGDKSKNAVGHCAYVVNWDYGGGAPKSEAKVSRPILREVPAENTANQDCA